MKAVFFEYFYESSLIRFSSSSWERQVSELDGINGSILNRLNER